MQGSVEGFQLRMLLDISQDDLKDRSGARSGFWEAE